LSSPWLPFDPEDLRPGELLVVRAATLFWIDLDSNTAAELKPGALLVFLSRDRDRGLRVFSVDFGLGNVAPSRLLRDGGGE
jgi:hypothetical protein